MNKNFFFVTASIVALGVAAPAFGADLAARHQMYTKAPPAVAAIYDWSGFYIGGNGGWGNSHNSCRWPDRLSLADGPVRVRP
jgi:outer membrane immunogenic protein